MIDNEKLLIAFKDVGVPFNLRKVRQLSSVKSTILSDNGLQILWEVRIILINTRAARVLRDGKTGGNCDICVWQYILITSFYSAHCF